MEDGYQSFVNIAKSDSDDCMELPREKDGTVLLSTVQAQFPTAIGLKYKSSSGGWRGIRAENNVLDPPYGGWGEGIYIITESDALKRKATEQNNGYSKSTKSSKLLEDLIVLGLPYSTTEEELNQFFTDSCGELSFCELKLDRTTKKSRGFGFIRFKDEEAAQAAVKGHHEIEGRKLNVRLSKKPQNDIPMKLFIGRLPHGTTREDVNDYFSDFGELTDVFVPTNPFRGFAFITYSSQEDAMKVMRMTHTLLGGRLNVTAAEPREEKGPPERQENIGNTNYTWNSNSSNPSFGQNTGSNPSFGQNAGSNPSYGQNTGYSTRSFQQETAPVKKDVISELKDMIFTLINNQK